MGLFSRKKTSESTTSGGSRKNSSSLADVTSMSSQSSLKSPVTPGTPGFSNFTKMSAPMNPAIPKINLPKAPDPHVDPAGYLRSIGAVRERSLPVLVKAKANRLNHFEVDMSKFEDTTKFVVSIIKVHSFCATLCSVLMACAARFRSRLCEYSSPRPMATL
jgi:hypothetical protein